MSISELFLAEMRYKVFCEVDGSFCGLTSIRIKHGLKCSHDPTHPVRIEWTLPPPPNPGVVVKNVDAIGNDHYMRAPGEPRSPLGQRAAQKKLNLEGDE
jgi:hypothetical protein